MDEPLYIQRTGSVYFDADDDAPLTELKSVLQQHSARRYRRIDRFTQLALIGASRCARDIPLAENTSVYLASGKGPASNNIAMQEAIVRDQLPPMPVQFINAVSNSVSFYVMQDHELQGQALFLSREIHAFEAALRIAAVDLALLPVSSALLGFVDEITQPLSEQRARLGLPTDVPLGEGSHWFLLGLERNNQTLGAVLHNELYGASTDLIVWLKQLTLTCQVFFGQGIDAAAVQDFVQYLPDSSEIVTSAERLWDGLNAGMIAGFLHEDCSENDIYHNHLLVISCDSAKRYHVTLTQRF